MSESKKKEAGLEIQLDDAVARGTYANLMLVNHSESEVLLDFVFVQPHAPRAKVSSRIIASPRQAKRFMLALKDSLDRYEEVFGPIDRLVPEFEGDREKRH
jgi:hypothetical protein